MNILEIPVRYRDKELNFKAHVARFGYVTHIIVDLNGVLITIERDEEGDYRALGDVEEMQTATIDVQLIHAVVGVLQSL